MNKTKLNRFDKAKKRFEAAHDMDNLGVKKVRIAEILGVSDALISAYLRHDTYASFRAYNAAAADDRRHRLSAETTESSSTQKVSQVDMRVFGETQDTEARRMVAEVAEDVRTLFERLQEIESQMVRRRPALFNRRGDK